MLGPERQLVEEDDDVDRDQRDRDERERSRGGGSSPIGIIELPPAGRRAGRRGAGSVPSRGCRDGADHFVELPRRLRYTTTTFPAARFSAGSMRRNSQIRRASERPGARPGARNPHADHLTKESRMKPYDAEHVFNVALVSHGGAGKTSLVEAMLFTIGRDHAAGQRRGRQHHLRLRSRRGQARDVGQPCRRAGRVEVQQGQPAGHARLRRLLRRGRRGGPRRRRRHRRGRRRLGHPGRHRAGLARARRAQPAAPDRHQQAGPRELGLRPGPGRSFASGTATRSCR